VAHSARFDWASPAPSPHPPKRSAAHRQTPRQSLVFTTLTTAAYLNTHMPTMPPTKGTDLVRSALNLDASTYSLLYCEVEAGLFNSGLLGKSLKLLSSQGKVVQIAATAACRFPAIFRDVPPEERIEHIKRIAIRCNHNYKRVNKRRQKYNIQAASATRTTADMLPGESTIQCDIRSQFVQSYDIQTITPAPSERHSTAEATDDDHAAVILGSMQVGSNVVKRTRN
jgi:hypothetical protein